MTLFKPSPGKRKRFSPEYSFNTLATHILKNYYDTKAVIVPTDASVLEGFTDTASLDPQGLVRGEFCKEDEEKEDSMIYEPYVQEENVREVAPNVPDSSIIVAVASAPPRASTLQKEQHNDKEEAGTGSEGYENTTAAITVTADDQNLNKGYAKTKSKE